MRRSQVLVALLLTATFAAGVAGGVAADRLWLRPPPAGAEEGRRPTEADERDGEEHEKEEGDDTVIERFSEELGLSGRQEARIDTILRHYRRSMEELRHEVRPRYDALVDSARRRIEGVLDSAQARKYRRLLERKHGDEEDEREKRGETGEKRDARDAGR